MSVSSYSACLCPVKAARVLQDAANTLEASWQPQRRPLRGRGAALADPTAQPHPLYAAQRLFSFYMHTPPDFGGYGADSVFRGREIAPHTHGARYSHTLGHITVLLVEAALVDTRVHNARFVTASEACVPLYNVGVLYLQLMADTRSRVGAVQQGGLEESLESFKVRFS